MKTSLADQPYAVVDCETTRLFPGAHHRIVEIAVLNIDSGRVTNEWSTLLNPDRDLGETDIHGIYAADAWTHPSSRRSPEPCLSFLLVGFSLHTTHASTRSSSRPSLTAWAMT